MGTYELYFMLIGVCCYIGYRFRKFNERIKALEDKVNGKS